MDANNENQVAVYIDYENVVFSCREKIDPDHEVDWTSVMEAAADLGRVTIRRAYANWSLHSAAQRELLGLGIDLVHVASKGGKNAADIKIVIDAFSLLSEEYQDISHILLVSGDSDFTEVVHRLRARGKYVVGLGVRGASAEYLINACDQFIFYNTLIPKPTKVTKRGTPGKPIQPVSDVIEARQLLRRVLQSREGEWVSAGLVKSAMLRLNPAFNERNYNFDSFKLFLEAQNDLVKIRTAQPGGHLEAQTVPEDESPPPAETVPEAVLDKYLEYLSQQRVRMTPTEHRPAIIFRFYDIYRKNRGSSLTELKEDLHNYYEENAPEVTWQNINETIHELFRTYCFEFDQEGENYPEEARLWDRKVTLTDDIKRRADLLDKCDRGLLRKIGRKLGSISDINPDVAARLLYGSVRGQRMLEHVKSMIQEMAQQPEPQEST